MIRHVLVLFLFGVIGTALFAQTPFELISEKTVEGDRLVVDDLGNIYLMNQTGIERQNALGGGVFRTSEMQWGEFHDIDVTDPLRPFIHFPSTGKIVFFDNTLSVQGSPIDLFEFGFDNVEFMCGSRGDGYWLWDARNSEIVRVDRSFNRIVSTGNLSILLKKEIRPRAMIERGSHLFLLNSDNTLQVFDMFGMWKKSLTVGEVLNWSAESTKLYLFCADGKMHILDTFIWQTHEVALPIPGVRCAYQSPFLYCLSGGRLSTYRLVENTRN